MEGKWPYSCGFVGCCFQNLFNIAYSICVQFPFSFFSICFVTVHVDPYSSTDTTTAWKKFHLNLSDRSDFHITHCQLLAAHAFTKCILTSFSVDETQLPRYMKVSTDFMKLPFRLEMGLSWFKHMYTVLFVFTSRPMPPDVCSRQCSRDSAWVGVFTRSTMLTE